LREGANDPAPAPLPAFSGEDNAVDLRATGEHLAGAVEGGASLTFSWLPTGDKLGARSSATRTIKRRWGWDQLVAKLQTRRQRRLELLLTLHRARAGPVRG
jgi:hypothetical protein